jgi:hypothetical protein
MLLIDRAFDPGLPQNRAIQVRFAGANFQQISNGLFEHV